MTMTSARARLSLSLAALALGVAACAGGLPTRDGPPNAGAREERPTMIVRPGALMLTGLDSNHDYIVSRAELTTGEAMLFSLADSNNDGRIMPVEFNQWAQMVLGTVDGTPGRISFDADTDGVITKAEFITRVEQVFNQLDADHDGNVPRAEFVQHFAPRPGPPEREGGFGSGGGRRGGGGPGRE